MQALQCNRFRHNTSPNYGRPHQQRTACSHPAHTWRGSSRPHRFARTRAYQRTAAHSRPGPLDPARRRTERRKTTAERERVHL